LETQRLVPQYEQLRNAGIVVYSIIVLATIIPNIPNVPGVILMPYYLLVPGYCVTTLMEKKQAFIERLFFSVCWSLAIIASVVAINSLNLASLPLNAAVPVITVFILAIVHFRTEK